MPTVSDATPNDTATSPAPIAAGDARLTIVQQLFRFVLVLAFLSAAQFLTACAMAFAMYGYTRAIFYLAIGIGLFAGCAMLINRQILKIFGNERPRYFSLVVPVAAACAAIVFYLIYESQPRELWVGLAYLSALITVISGLLVLGRLKAYSWTCLGVVFVAVASSLFVFEYRPLTAAQAAAKTHARKQVFQSLLADLKKLDESDDFERAFEDATEETEYYGTIPSIDSNLLVVGFKEWVSDAELVHSPFYIEGYLPPDMLASEPSDIQVIAVVEAIHSTRTGKESPLIMRVLLYSWPDQTRLARVRLDIGRKSKHSGFQVFPAAAAALRRFVNVAINESADPANIIASKDKLAVGMTLEESAPVTVKASPEALQEIASWDKRVVFFTSAKNPVASLNDVSIANGEVGTWGLELSSQVAEVLGQDIIGMEVIGDVGEGTTLFHETPGLRLFVTWDKFEEPIVTTGGGAKVVFQEGKP